MAHHQRSVSAAVEPLMLAGEKEHLINYNVKLIHGLCYRNDMKQQ